MTQHPSLAVVIATCRPDSFKRWVEAWKQELHGAYLYVVEDQPYKTDDVKFACRILGSCHSSWHEIDTDLGDKSWIIPRRTSAIKSYGFLQAYNDGHDYIWTLDDDCFPEVKNYIPTLKHLLEIDQIDDSWWNTITDTGLYPRGYPYGIRQAKQPVMVHHGLWSGVPDLDGITALEHHSLRLGGASGHERVPTGTFFPMCGMNLAFRREIAPAMYFMLQGRVRDTGYDQYSFNGEPGTNPLPFDRFDDIWAGLFAKKICDNFGYAVTSGAPSILHTKESDPTQRVIKEGPGIAAHELLWRIIADARIPSSIRSAGGAYAYLANVVDSASTDLPYPEYWTKLAEAMHIWTELF